MESEWITFIKHRTTVTFLHSVVLLPLTRSECFKLLWVNDHLMVLFMYIVLCSSFHTNLYSWQMLNKRVHAIKPQYFLISACILQTNKLASLMPIAETMYFSNISRSGVTVIGRVSHIGGKPICLSQTKPSVARFCKMLTQGLDYTYVYNQTERQGSVYLTGGFKYLNLFFLIKM